MRLSLLKNFLEVCIKKIFSDLPTISGVEHAFENFVILGTLLLYCLNGIQMRPDQNMFSRYILSGDRCNLPAQFIVLANAYCY